MSDWDFLHDMHNDGYRAEQIADAAACGYNPWEWQPLNENDLPAVFSQENSQLFEIVENLVDSAKSYHELTGRYLQIWGELGEFYAEIKYGIKRHKPHTRGSDGKLGNDFIEIKTILGNGSIDAGKSVVHGKPLEKSDITLIKNKLGIKDIPFNICDTIPMNERRK